MFCLHCGAENDDDSLFCTQCGARFNVEQDDAVGENASLADAATNVEEHQTISNINSAPEKIETSVINETSETNETPDINETSEINETPDINETPVINGPVNNMEDPNNNNSPQKEKDRKKIAVISTVVSLAIVLLVVWGCFLSRVTSDQRGYLTRKSILSGVIDEEYTGYVQLMDGNSIKIKDVVWACMTPDRKKIVYLSNNNCLYIMNPDASEKIRISDAYKDLGYIDDYIVLYSNDEDEFIRYSIADNSAISLEVPFGELWYRILCSENNGNVLYSDGDSVYKITSANGKERLSRVDGYCIPMHISDNGAEAVWMDVEQQDDDLEGTLYTYKDGARSKIGELDVTDDAFGSIYPLYISNATGSYAVMTCESCDELYVLNKNQDPIHVKLGDYYHSDSDVDCISTINGPIQNDNSSTFNGIYAILSEDEKYLSQASLYYIDKTGDRERVVSNIQGYSINDGYIVYLNKDDELIRGRLNGSEIENEKKIADDVDGTLTRNGTDYIYYFKDMSKSGEVACLYVVKGNGSPRKISGDCYTNYVHFSADFKTAYYFKEYDGDDNTGSLYKYDYGRNKSERISDSVRVDSLTSGYYDTEILDNDAFSYKKTISKHDYNWIFYNGKESIVQIKELEIY